MKYKQIVPHQALKPFIDAFWMASGDSVEIKTEKILPDGCVDLIFNLGADCETENHTFTLKSENVYLVGPMTRFKLTTLNQEALLTGVRFKPGAFPLFFKFEPLYELKDQTIDFNKALTPDPGKVACSVDYLNKFFLKRLKSPRHNLLKIIEEIRNCDEKWDIKQLARRHFTTVRQLERNFKQHVGMGPKEFVNLVRYQNAVQQIRQKKTGKSLLDIAFDCGYYDHSHLTNEIKKYTGVNPSAL